MIVTAFCIVLTYFLPAFLYLYLEIRRNRNFSFRGQEYDYRGYIIQVSIDCLSRTLILVADLLQDLSLPLLRLGDIEEEQIWQISVLAAHQMLMFSILNLATLLFFLPIEWIVQRLRDLQMRRSLSSQRS